MNKKILIISGTPGTGKAKLAVFLSKKLDLYHLDLHYCYQQIASKYNRHKKCYDIDLKKFTELVESKKNASSRGLVIDSHIAHLLPKRLVDLCIVLICSDLKKLKRRLKKRKYSAKKIKENLEAEIFQVCLEEAREKGQKVLVFDQGEIISKKEILNEVKKLLHKPT